ncbi:hypothetical protein DICPUDRAFT_81386 [Dictyostelium purpureum]|uniref:Rab-GAP TBC domain-containing protein n=1 Tax=Dictyostelium purpureum TaxID=5786 RepID=F0ZTB8_DICPU|nr:uncharacterized protein DICPUDRAFT_81386 [Dictyostelium purpureum]EGC32803.1 hypothetical protein DICPUDRAFT_81386 [Dictyostelium purpureum]|eukprot:XP_003290661.1 hypothetical protein DICPUDRAFT_81386 [Dictyostelium purpureum]
MQEQEIKNINSEKIEESNECNNKMTTTTTTLNNEEESNKITIENSVTVNSKPTISHSNSNSSNSSSNNNNSNNDIVKLEPYPNVMGKFPIHEAVYKNDLETLKQFFGEESLVNTSISSNTNNNNGEEDDDDDEDDTDPHNTSSVSNNGKPSINDRDDQVSCITGRKIAKQLIAKGSKVNAPDNTGQTPIFYAAKSGHPKNVTSLLRLGANATVKDYQNRTPLHFSLDIANSTISSMLVSAGADVTLRYKYGQKGERPVSPRKAGQWKGENNTIDDEEYAQADLYGFLPDVSSNSTQMKRWNEIKDYYMNLMKVNLSKDKRLEKRWVKLLRSWSSNGKKSKVQNLGWKGVPESTRGVLWKLILDPTKTKLESKVNYEQLLERDSDFVKQIDLDIDRTYRNHIIFRERFNQGQQQLFNVLKAYSIYDQDVGYCQGMSSIASLLLMYMTEEEAFWSLVSLMENPRYQFRGLFLPSFPLLYRNYAIHEILMHDELPKIQSHFSVEGITTSMYATKWFLTIFSGNIPFPLLVRFWDLVLLNGYYIVHSLSIHVLRSHQDILSKDPFEKILNFFSTLEQSEIDVNNFIKNCKKHKILEKKIEKLNKKYDLQQQNLGKEIKNLTTTTNTSSSSLNSISNLN